MACNYQGKIVTNGLVLCLDAADKKSYPGTGTVWTDRSENGNHGTLTNGPTFNGANGGSIVFDGPSDGVLLPNISPTSKLQVTNGDIEVETIASGLILKSPDGTRYRVTAVNGGTLSVSAV